MALIVGVVTACGTDPAEPDDVPLVAKDIYDLVEVNATLLPAVVVQGRCGHVLYPMITYPDTIEIDGGRLTLMTNGSYELYYMWHGKTNSCTLLGLHWHRMSAGDYAALADTLAFLPDTMRATSRPTQNRTNHWDPPTGFRNGADIFIDWGPLHLRYVLVERTDR